MCAGAMIHARIEHLVFGTTDPRAGAVMTIYNIGRDKKLNHTIKVTGGVMAEKCSRLLKDFFQGKR